MKYLIEKCINGFTLEELDPTKVGSPGYTQNKKWAFSNMEDLLLFFRGLK